MKYLPLIVVLALVAALAFGLWRGAASDAEEGFATLDTERHIVIHCGNSMRPVAERIAERFQREQGIAVRFNFGGSAALLAAIALGEVGDLYLCHDPYAKRLADAGLLARAETVGHLEPVLIVAPGNPLAIGALADLATPGLRVGLPDARYSTAGAMVAAELQRRDLAEAVQRNTRVQTRGHNDVAMALINGHVDVAMAWNFITGYHAARLEPVATGIDWPETRVTLCLLTHARDLNAAQRFIDLAQSPWGRQTFHEMGYTRSGPAP